MLIIAGTIQIDPAKVEEARAAASTMMTETRKEPGNVAYVFSLDLDVPGRIHLFERWESEAALTTHFSTPHMLDFQRRIGGFGVEDMRLEKFTVSDVGPVR